MKKYNNLIPLLTLKHTISEYNKERVSTPDDVYRVLMNFYNKDTISYTEEIVILYLNVTNNIVGVSNHTSGSMNGSLIDVRVMLTKALLSGAMKVIISHNHPSGQMYPSKDDENITIKCKEACKAIGIELIDHIIVSGIDNNYYSFNNEGKL